MKKTRDLLNHHAFGTDPALGVSMDHNKHLIVPPWTDSLQSIVGEGADSANMDVMKHHYTTNFPQSVSLHSNNQNDVLVLMCLQVDEQTALPADPAKDGNFKEPSIDELRAQKDEDLERYRKDMERRARHWGDDFEASLKY